MKINNLAFPFPAFPEFSEMDKPLKTMVFPFPEITPYYVGGSVGNGFP